MKLDEKLKRNMAIVAGGFILLILIIALITSCTKSKTYSIDQINELQTKLIELAREYYTNNESSLPSEGQTTVLSIQALVDANKIKPLSKVIENGENCSGQINVTNNSSYILFTPMIDCGTMYKSQTLADTLTASENIVTTNYGLYTMSNGYVYRGEFVNNYINFANKLWVILRINTDGTVKLLEVPRRDGGVWDNRFNQDRLQSVGYNNYIHDNMDSRIRHQITNIYKNELSYNDKAHLLPQTLCIGSRTITDNVNDGSIECRETLQNEYLGLLAVYEYLQVSLDANCHTIEDRGCVNHNYMANLSPAFWTITPDSQTSYRIYRVSRSIDITNTSSSSSLKLTALISGDLVLSSGDGSYENPYTLITSPIIESNSRR